MTLGDLADLFSVAVATPDAQDRGSAWEHGHLSDGARAVASCSSPAPRCCDHVGCHAKLGPMADVPLGGGGSRVARLASFVTGRLASWVGVVFWLAVVAVAIPFANKIGTVETSRLTEFLPSGAASTTGAATRPEVSLGPGPPGRDRLLPEVRAHRR